MYEARAKAFECLLAWLRVKHGAVVFLKFSFKHSSGTADYRQGHSSKKLK